MRCRRQSIEFGKSGGLFVWQLRSLKSGYLWAGCLLFLGLDVITALSFVYHQ